MHGKRVSKEGQTLDKMYQKIDTVQENQKNNMRVLKVCVKENFTAWK